MFILLIQVKDIRIIKLSNYYYFYDLFCHVYSAVDGPTNRLLSLNIIRRILMATGCNYAYPKCLGSFCDSNLEICQTETCNNEFHHACL